MANDNFWQQKGDKDVGIGYVGFAKGVVTTVITANVTATLTGDTTYTSGQTSIFGFNSLFVTHLATTAGTTGKTNISGALSSGGTMVALIDKDTTAQMTTGSLASTQIKRFSGLPDYVSFSTTLSSGTTAGTSFSVIVQPFNM